MTVAEYFRALRKRWKVVVAAVIIGVALAAGFTLQQKPLYSSQLTFFVSIPGDASTTSNQTLANDQATILRVNSYLRVLSSDVLAKQIITTTKLNMTPRALAKEISGSAALNTTLLKATVSDHSAQRAYQIAQAVGADFQALIQSIDSTGAAPAGATGNPQQVTLKVISDPTLPTVPVSPHKTTNLILGLAVGLILGLMIVALRELTDTSVHSGDDLQEITESPVLASIGFDKSARRSPLIAMSTGLRSQRAEEYRRLRTNLQYTSVDDPVRTVAVTSTFAGEGKSSTAVNLAIAVAETGKRVLLIEADLRRPRVTNYLGLENVLGLTNVLAGQLSVDEALQEWGTDGLLVLGSGSLPPNPSELLGSRAMADLMAGLRERFDFIVMDTPPLAPVIDAAVASAVVDGVVLVVHAGATSRHGLATALDALQSVEARVLGVVLNMVKHRGGRGYGYVEGYYAEPEPSPLRRLFRPVPGAGETGEPTGTPSVPAKAQDAARRGSVAPKPPVTTGKKLLPKTPMDAGSAALRAAEQGRTA